jgi:hypothetical protein
MDSRMDSPEDTTYIRAEDAGLAGTRPEVAR